MDIHQLKNFLAVAELLHFSRAAERVHLSQPALSIQIRMLEDELGVRLFERSRRGTRLTAAGSLYRAEVQEIVEHLQRAAVHARLAAQGKIGRIRIGFISTAAVHIVPPLVSAFRKSHPDVELELFHALTAEQIRMLDEQSIDIGFFRIPAERHPGIALVPVHQEPFKLFLPAAHPLTERKRLVLSDLDGVDFLVYARRNAPGFHDYLLRILRDAGATPALITEANDMYTLISLVSAGVGVAIGPSSLQTYGLPNVTVRDIAALPPSKIAIAFREKALQPAAKAFVDLAIASATP